MPFQTQESEWLDSLVISVATEKQSTQSYTLRGGSKQNHINKEALLGANTGAKTNRWRQFQCNQKKGRRTSLAVHRTYWKTGGFLSKVTERFWGIGPPLFFNNKKVCVYICTPDLFHRPMILQFKLVRLFPIVLREVKIDVFVCYGILQNAPSKYISTLGALHKCYTCTVRDSVCFNDL